MEFDGFVVKAQGNKSGYMGRNGQKNVLALATEILVFL